MVEHGASETFAIDERFRMFGFVELAPKMPACKAKVTGTQYLSARHTTRGV